MTKRLLIDATHDLETRVALLEEDTIEHFDFSSASKRQLKGNIYLGKITRVEPSLQAAFVEYGGGRQGFLSFSEIHPDYYQIPIADRQRLMEEAARAAEEAERAEEAEYEREQAALKAEEGRDAEEDRREDHAHDSRDEAAHEPDRLEDEIDGSAEFVPPQEAHAAAESAAAAEETFGSPASDSDALEQGAKATEEHSAETGEESTGEGRPRRRRRGVGRPKQARAQAPMETSSEPMPAGDDDDQHESHASEDGDHEERKARATFSRRYKIQEVIKANQIVLIQVVKEERGNKGCSLSTYISLPGRYCVLMPNSPKDGGISRKIGSGGDRKRLKDIATELKESRGMSAIIRTAGIDRTKTEIKRDYEYLIKLWGQTRDLALSSTAPALVYEEGDIVKRTIRDHYNGDIDEILVQGETAHKAAKDFMKMIMPSHAVRVKQFTETQPLFNAYGVEEQLAELYLPIAPLPSGGYLVINPTEALISIDVNSGRSTTERNVEETAYKTNLEAADEVARQLRLRDLGGLVVIDFIDMSYGKHRRTVEKAVKDAMKDDRAKVQVGHISAFGLMELSRQRLGSSLFEATMTDCPHCKASGHVRSQEATAMALVRELESEAFEHGAGSYTLQLTARDMTFIVNHYRAQIAGIEAAYNIHLSFEIDPSLTDGMFVLDNGRGSAQAKRNQEQRPAKRRRGGRNRSRGDERGPASSRPLMTPEQDEHAEIEPAEAESADAESPRAGETERPGGGEPREGGKRRRSRRGRRGGQRNREGRETTPEGDAADAAGEPAVDAQGETPDETPEHQAISGEPETAPSDAARAVDPEPVAEPAEQAAPKPKARARAPRAPRKTPTPIAAEGSGDVAPAVAKPASRAASTGQKKTAKPMTVEVSHQPPSEESADSDEPKRKGWWSKITG